MSDLAKILIVSDTDADEIAQAVGPGFSIVRITDPGSVADSYAGVLAAVVVSSAVWHDADRRETIRNRADGAPIVVVTAESEAAESVVRHLHLGASTFVPKHKATYKLRSTIEQMVQLLDRDPIRATLRPFLVSTAAVYDFPSRLESSRLAAGFLDTVLAQFDLADENDRFRLRLAVSEAMTNAIVHGNFGIDSAIRETDPGAYFEAIEQAERSADADEKRVRVEFSVTPTEAAVAIQDDGQGFNTAGVQDPTSGDALTQPSGRGLLLMRAYTDSLEWNQTGNRITLRKGLRAP
ncbi:MAG: ATP-binding protein [Planctomycetota bacterium]